MTKKIIHTKINLNKKLAILGTGGFSSDILVTFCDIFPHINYKDFIVFVSQEEEYTTKELFGCSILSEKNLTIDQHQLIASPANPQVRAKVVRKFPHFEFVTLAHPFAHISQWTNIGKGCVIMAGVTMTANTKLGDHGQINPQVTIGHDTKMGDFFTAAPGANIGGNCILAEQIYVGSNAAIKQGLNIVSHTILGMGSTLLSDIVLPGTYVGCPAKKIK